MKPRASDNIPVLSDVLVPGSLAARGRSDSAQLSLDAFELEPSPGNSESIDKRPAEKQKKPLQATSAADIESLVDAILAKHLQQMRAELVQEIKLLLKENYLAP